MVRHYVRKSSRPPPSKDRLQCAVTEVIEKRMSVRVAAEYFELARSTVFDYVRKVQESGNVVPNQLKRSCPVQQMFSPSLEIDLAEYLKKCSLMSHGLTPLETRKLAFLHFPSFTIRFYCFLHFCSVGMSLLVPSLRGFPLQST